MIRDEGATLLGSSTDFVLEKELELKGIVVISAREIQFPPLNKGRVREGLLRYR